MRYDKAQHENSLDCRTWGRSRPPPGQSCACQRGRHSCTFCNQTLAPIASSARGPAATHTVRIQTTRDVECLRVCMLVRTWASLWQMEQSNHALQHGARMELRQHRVSVTLIARPSERALFKPRPAATLWAPSRQPGCREPTSGGHSVQCDLSTTALKLKRTRAKRNPATAAHFGLAQPRARQSWIQPRTPQRDPPAPLHLSVQHMLRAANRLLLARAAAHRRADMQYIPCTLSQATLHRTLSFAHGEPTSI